MKSATIWGTLHPFFEGGEIMGRSVANEGFIRALLRKDAFSAYHFFLSDEKQQRNLSALLQAEYPAMWADGRFLVQTVRQLPQALQRYDYHCFHLSDCVLHSAHLARVRNALSRRIFPITGVTHSLSYARYGAMFFAQMWQGTTGRDAVVATSRAGVSMVERVFAQVRREYSLDEAVYTQPEVVQIPLGVEPDTFPYKDERLREVTRKQLDVGPDDVMLLVLARVSYYSKMDLIPLMRALQRIKNANTNPAGACSCVAAEGGAEGLFGGVSGRSPVNLHGGPSGGPSGAQSGGLSGETSDTADDGGKAVTSVKNVADSFVLVLAGYVQEGDDTPEMLRAMAKAIGVRLVIVPTPSDEQRNGLYAAADIFVSPSDNIQETFGLTMLEAGASGLPVVASDFDGYRDLIVHGSHDAATGVLVPTLGPATTAGIDMMAALAYDTATHLDLAQQTVVDVPALGGALYRLAADRELRERLGENGRCRVCDHYSWDAVVEQYLELWERLNTVPVDADALRAQIHPQHMVYSDVFGAYPSGMLSGEMRLVWSVAGQAVYRGQDFPIIYGGIDDRIDTDLLRKLLFMARKSVTVDVLRSGLLKAGIGAVPGAGINAGKPSASGPEVVNGKMDANMTDMQVEQADFLILWALKQDLLERVTAGQEEGK